MAKILNVSLDWLFEDELVVKEDSVGQQSIPPGIVAGFEAFSYAISNVLECSTSENDDSK